MEQSGIDCIIIEGHVIEWNMVKDLEKDKEKELI